MPKRFYLDSLLWLSSVEARVKASEQTETHPAFHYFRSSSTPDGHP